MITSKIDLSPLLQLDPLSEPISLKSAMESWKKHLQTNVTALTTSKKGWSYYIRQGKLHKKS